jgi:hypothetical protein
MLCVGPPNCAICQAVLPHGVNGVCASCYDRTYPNRKDLRLCEKSETVIVKKCRCGLEYTEALWNKLPLVGRQDLEDEELELRNCVCTSTLALVTKPEKVD